MGCTTSTPSGDIDAKRTSQKRSRRRKPTTTKSKMTQPKPVAATTPADRFSILASSRLTNSSNDEREPPPGKPAGILRSSSAASPTVEPPASDTAHRPSASTDTVSSFATRDWIRSSYCSSDSDQPMASNSNRRVKFSENPLEVLPIPSRRSSISESECDADSQARV